MNKRNSILLIFFISQNLLMCKSLNQGLDNQQRIELSVLDDSDFPPGNFDSDFPADNYDLEHEIDLEDDVYDGYDDFDENTPDLIQVQSNEYLALSNRPIQKFQFWNIRVRV